MRISKFLSSFLLTQNQRELVKFMKQYTLITRLPKSSSGYLYKATTKDSVSLEDGKLIGQKRSPFEDLLEYSPDKNNIDSLLHKNILDPDELSDITISHSQISASKVNQEDSEEEEMVEKYFEEYFHPTQNVSTFLQGFKADLEAP